MNTNLRSAFQQAVRAAARSWPPDGGSGDPNTVDIYWHAQRVTGILQLQLPLVLPPKETGVAIVELVEHHFIGSSLVRDLSLESLAHRAGKLVDAVQHGGLLSFGEQQGYVVALYGWHGCIYMAKLLRQSFVVPGGEAPYSLEHRLQGYGRLRECWSQEDARANPWVRYGVSLARSLEKTRKGDRFGELIVENWVPSDSPYWDR